MAEQNGSGIAWTEQTWNPVRGCSRVSEGCRNCYAERVAARFSGPGLPYFGLAKMTAAGARWTGKVQLVPEHLRDPLRWTRPRRVFVNSMSDLFHEQLDAESIARVFAVMYLAHQHSFQVLTKRARRMRELLTGPGFYAQVLDAAAPIREDLPKLGGVGISDPTKFPHANVWLGVSVEDQTAADERVPELLGTPAAVRWLSIEPQLGPVDLSKWLKPSLVTNEGLRLQHPDPRIPSSGGRWEWSGINWVVIGGESGPGARPFNIQWARDLVRQCQQAGVAVFVKQLGAVPVLSESDWRAKEHLLLSAYNKDRAPEGTVPLKFSSKAGDPAEWPVDLRVREYPEARP
jgi:protein gp37